MKTLDYDKAHKVVQTNRGLYWEGWDIIAWNRNPNGATNQNGKFLNGKWGITKRFPLRDNGTWEVPNRYDH